MYKKQSRGGSSKRKVGWPNQVLELEELKQWGLYELWSSNTGTKGTFIATDIPYMEDSKWVLDALFLKIESGKLVSRGIETIKLENYGMVPYDDGSFHRTHYIRIVE